MSKWSSNYPHTVTGFFYLLSTPKCRTEQLIMKVKVFLLPYVKSHVRVRTVALFFVEWVCRMYTVVCGMWAIKLVWLMFSITVGSRMCDAGIETFWNFSLGTVEYWHYGCVLGRTSTSWKFVKIEINDGVMLVGHKNKTGPWVFY